MSNMWAGMRPRVPQTPNLTKQDIDALVDGMPHVGGDLLGRVSMHGGHWVAPENCRKSLYLAAGLTAEGERKLERVRMWRGKSQWSGAHIWFEQEPKPDEFLVTDLTPGWFVPDGEA